MSRKLLSLAGLALAALLVALAAPGRAQEEIYKVGDKVAAVPVKNLAGKDAGLGSLEGKVVLLNFYSFRCGACNAEAPELEKDVWQAYKDRGVVVVGVGRDVDGAKKLKARHALTYDMWVDDEGRLFDRFVDQYIPWNAIIDRDGILRYTKVGWEPAPIKKALDDALAKK